MSTDTTAYIPDEHYRRIIASIPIPTVDIVIFNSKKSEVLLFFRKNRPVKGEYYSVGGRIYKGEEMEIAAQRKFLEEAGISAEKEDFIFGGIMDEFFEDSLYPSVSMHSLNIYFGYVLREENAPRYDENQFTDKKWFDIADSKIHPYVQEKIQTIIAKL